MRVTTSISDYLVRNWIYRACVVTTLEYDTCKDFIVLDMVYFDGILGMYWFSLYHVIFYSSSKIVTMCMSDNPLFVWTDSDSHMSRDVILFVTMCQLVENDVYIICY